MQLLQADNRCLLTSIFIRVVLLLAGALQVCCIVPPAHCFRQLVILLPVRSVVLAAAEENVFRR